MYSVVEIAGHQYKVQAGDVSMPPSLATAFVKASITPSKDSTFLGALVKFAPTLLLTPRLESHLQIEFEDEIVKVGSCKSQEPQPNIQTYSNASPLTLFEAGLQARRDGLSRMVIEGPLAEQYTSLGRRGSWDSLSTLAKVVEVLKTTLKLDLVFICSGIEDSHNDEDVTISVKAGDELDYDGVIYHECEIQQKKHFSRSYTFYQEGELDWNQAYPHGNEVLVHGW